MSESVLIVDADKATRKELELVLSKEKIKALSAGDYDAALSMREREKAGVLIVDIALHGGNGWKLALDVLAKTPETIVFATSSNVDLKLGRAIIKRGVREVLYKPYCTQTLAKKIVFSLHCRTPAAKKKQPEEAAT